ncbi:MAG: type I 3-dehydroquinate dehydratase [Chloroflexota bacterium]
MARTKICAVIVSSDLQVLGEIEDLIDLFEVRLDLIGPDWPEVVSHLGKPWIAANRIPEEGGKAKEDESERVEDLLKAVGLGASIVDLELRTENLKTLVPLIKKRARCLLSYHDLKGTPPLNQLKDTVRREIASGADICKVVTTARSTEDNITALQLIREFPGVRMVSLAMGDLGLASRILSPIVGGDFTYATLTRGKESAPGQMTVLELRRIYEMMGEKLESD